MCVNHYDDSLDDVNRICARTPSRCWARSVTAFLDDGFGQLCNVDWHELSMEVNLSSIWLKFSRVNLSPSCVATSVFLVETVNSSSTICAYVSARPFFAVSSWDRIDWATPSDETQQDSKVDRSKTHCWWFESRRERKSENRSKCNLLLTIRHRRKEMNSNEISPITLGFSRK